MSDQLRRNHNEPEYPELTVDQQATQLEQLSRAARMAVSAGTNIYTAPGAPFNAYQRLAPMTRSRLEITRALAWLISRNLITVAPHEDWEKFFSIDYPLPAHLDGYITNALDHAFRRGF